MNLKKLELLSEFIDTANHKEIIKDIIAEDEVLQKWHRYHLIGDIMRNQCSKLIDQNVAKKVTICLQNEPKIKATKVHYILPMALAASIVIFIATVLFFTNQQPMINQFNHNILVTGSQNHHNETVYLSEKEQQQQPERIININTYLSKHRAMVLSDKPMDIKVVNYIK